MARRNRSFRPSGRALDILNSINSPSTSRKQRDQPVRNSRRATHGGESQDVPENPENRPDIWQISVSPENRAPSPTPPRRSRRLQHGQPENSSAGGDSSRQKEQTPDVEEPGAEPEPEPESESESESESEELVSDGEGSEGSEQVSQEPLEEYSDSDERPDGQKEAEHEAPTKKRKTAAMDNSPREDGEEPPNTHGRDQNPHHRDHPGNLSSPTSRRQRRRVRSSSRVRIEIPPRASSPARPEASPNLHDQALTTHRALEDAPEPVKDNWFAQATHLGGQEGNWRALVEAVGVLRKTKVSSVEHYLGDVKGVVDLFRDDYKRTVIAPLLAGNAPPSDTAAEFDNLLAAIQQKGDQIMDVIYELTDPHAGRDLLDGFGARAIDWAYWVVKRCFHAYYIAGGRYRAARRHFSRALALLSWICRRLGSLAGGMKLETRQKELRRLEKPLAKLQEALESRALEPEALEGPIEGDTLRDLLLFRHGRKAWTDDEGQVLLDGLQRYQGPDRYYRILSQSGGRLLGRTAFELREQACELRHRILAQHGHELHSLDGRRKWQWLLSVREE